MYMANKIETFQSAHRQGHKYMRIEKSENTLCISRRSDNVRWLKSIIFCLILTINVCLPSVVLAESYYVDAVNGDDSNPGTEAQPWKTISKAQTEISAGDTVILRTGDYGKFTDTFADDIISGEPYTYTLPPETLWTTWKADSGHTPVFSKSGGNYAIELGTSSDMRKGAIIFDGIRVEGQVKISGVYGVKINNCEVVGTEPYIGDAISGISLTYTGDIVINNCEIHHSNCYGIVPVFGNNNIIITNNEIYDTGGDSISVKTGHRDNSNFLIEGNIVRDNTLWNPAIHADGIQLDGTGNDNAWTNFVIRNNTISNIDSASIIIDATLTPNLIIENNLVLQGSAQVLIGDTVDMIVRNNTFDCPFRLHSYNVGASVYNNIILGSINYDTSQVVNHNFNIVTNNFRGYAVGWNEPNGLNYANVTTAKAALFDTGYQLKATAPAVDFYTGTAATEATPVDDILYNMRDNSPDAGCYEYGSSPSDPDTTAPNEPQNLIATALSESQIDLSWDASSDPESGVSYYKIYRDSNEIDTSVSTSYSNTDLNGGTPCSYEVSAVNGQGLESGRSNTAQATTFSDATPPSIVSVGASETSVEITFSESLDTISAEDTSNYSITGGISVSVIAASVDIDTVTLTTSAHTEGTYILTVENVQDSSGNPMTKTTTDYEYDDGLVAHWKFDETSGITAADSSGNGNDGILINGPTWTTGKIDGAVSLDGVDDAIEIGTNNFNTTQGIISLWAYAESFSSSN